MSYGFETLAIMGLWLTMQDPQGAIHGPYLLDSLKGRPACEAQVQMVTPTMEAQYPGWELNFTCWPGQDT